jgi:hypothetical protein
MTNHTFEPISTKAILIAEDIMRTMRAEALDNMMYDQVPATFAEDEWECEGHSLIIGVYAEEDSVVYYDYDGGFIEDYATAKRELSITVQSILDEINEVQS